ncbi:MAG: BON domain-containing protein [Pirellulales bacterium]
MSSYIAHYGTPIHTAADADLLLRLGIALAARQRAAWRAVQLKAQNGVVRLEGILPTFHDRQLVLAVAQHVAGVLRVEDELTIAEPSSNIASSNFASSVIASHPAPQSDHGGTEEQPAKPASGFEHLPVLDESLEEILRKKGHAAPAAI